ncbi:olfactory receptor 2AT4-like [Scleropages formosus]|uniref:olfactory receptor 2AT4-like n=1 Tax=Scleropages formosus TaxID=113540 RepID=UPI0010FAB652|nr:olfactory receptor 2AT4-like [Scleropages formosus]
MEQNFTFNRPIGFFIMGLQSLPDSKYYFVFLAFVYIGTLVGNMFLMVIIWQSETLHTPKYMVVFSLSIVDVSHSTALVPKCINQFLFDSRFVTYDLCLAQMFFVHFFYVTESYSLVIMAFERLVSICFPLQSSTIITNTRMFGIIVFSWVLAFAILVAALVLITHLSFCKPVPTVMSYFCDHGPVFQIACSDNSPNLKMAVFFLCAVIYVPLGFILMSYVFIILAVSRITSLDGRWKTFKTCSVHLILVAIFFIPVLVIYIMAWIYVKVDGNTRIFNTSLSAVLPPLLNPIIYTLKTEEVLEQIRKFLRKRSVKPLW